MGCGPYAFRDRQGAGLPVPRRNAHMQIKSHRLLVDDGPVRFEATPNLGTGRLEAKYLVIHYTAGRSAASSIAWLTNREAGASAHLVIDREGGIVQLAGFDRITWHAGESRWRGLEGLNRHAIGIELDNAGILERKGGELKAWFGTAYPESESMEAAHRHDGVRRHWHVFTERQIAATAAVARALVAHYGLLDVIGHDDISPGRKQDPGPAFPMASVRNLAMGRESDGFPLFEAITDLNIRTGPGTTFDKLARSPLTKGTRLRVTRGEASWCAVEVPDADGDPDLTGWVHGDFIRPVA
jgi:N-acetylmuramoyl-L-alanine amidase